MKLEEAKEQLKSLQEDRKSFIENDKEHDEIYLKDIEAIDTAISELHAMQNLLDEKREEIERLQKENELAKKALIANSYEADERNNLLVKIQELQKENEELKEHNRKYLEAEIFSAKQIKNFEKQVKQHYIHKDKIREKIDNRISTVENLLDEMIDKSIGCINVSCLNKKEKEEVIAKRNCLTVQKATLVDIKKDLLKEE